MRRGFLLAALIFSGALAGASQGVDKYALWAGNTVLRGANAYQRRVYPALDGPYFLGPGPLGPPYTQADFDRLAAWGANLVVISHPGLFTEDPPYRPDFAVQENLDRLLGMAARAGLFAVISFRTGPGRSEFWAFFGEDTEGDPEGGWFDPSYYDNRVWGDRAAQDAWVKMWRYTAERYRGNPVLVGYELMCEPNSNEVGSYPLGKPLDIWDPEDFHRRYGGTLYDWNQLYPRIVAAIRRVDSTTPILLGGNGYSSVEWLPYLAVSDDPRIVYVVHQYEPGLYTHQWWDIRDCFYPGRCDVDWDGRPERVRPGLARKSFRGDRRFRGPTRRPRGGDGVRRHAMGSRSGPVRPRRDGALRGPGDEPRHLALGVFLGALRKGGGRLQLPPRTQSPRPSGCSNEHAHRGDPSPLGSEQPPAGT